MRKLWARFTALPVVAQKFALLFALLITWFAAERIFGIGLPDSWPWWTDGVFGACVGYLLGRVARFYGEVQQTRRDLSADAEAMRIEIERLERGDR